MHDPRSRATSAIGDFFLKPGGAWPYDEIVQPPPLPVSAQTNPLPYASVADMVREVSEVCPLPATTQRVMKLAKDPDADLADLIVAVEADPALAAEVMRLASSPLFLRGSKVDCDLRRSVQLLGMREIHTVASGMAMLAAFRSEHELAHHLHDVSVVTAVVARGLARVMKKDEGASYLIGLLSEIGAMACLAVDDAYAEIRGETQSPEGLQDAERARYQATSRHLGAELLRRNGLTGLVADAIDDLAVAEDAVLDKVGEFARQAALLIIDAGAGGSVSELGEQLGELGESLGLPMNRDRLEAFAIASGREAYQMIRSARER